MLKWACGAGRHNQQHITHNQSTYARKLCACSLPTKKHIKTKSSRIRSGSKGNGKLSFFISRARYSRNILVCIAGEEHSACICLKLD